MHLSVKGSQIQDKAIVIILYTGKKKENELFLLSCQTWHNSSFLKVQWMSYDHQGTPCSSSLCTVELNSLRCKTRWETISFFLFETNLNLPNVKYNNK